MKRETVCVVDDDIVYQFTARKLLSGIENVKNVLIFPDGEQAMDYLTQNIDSGSDLPGIIFLDINMPYMDGWRFLELFKEIKPRLPKPIEIHMVSSSPDHKDRERARGISEVADYIVKPISKEIFKDKVESYLQN